ncbi:hypothetical protein PAAG_11930 [Paracoccidioides lutzii Pb01]|uniref:Uncharacterized protein n=1 Tax=Paracoccidioides lutzii (strain ATCC MYA-826 / Pb01) TaxID=502779 RepID=A0A0A2V1H2_PARBA|nr:hypothetical protein PAAG_11930 [Paracoccidioides lutzii Pb01]KGQ01353.1 hypothetical protein PAAG_11930 [Paracoccidioides lutzii Pb01]
MVNFSLPGISYANRFFKDKNYYRCIILGQGNTGKTTLLCQLKLKEQIATIPTMRQTSNVETVHADVNELHKGSSNNTKLNNAIEDLKHILGRITEAKYLAVIFTNRNQMLRGDPRVERQISSVKETNLVELQMLRLILAARMEKNYVQGVSMKAMVPPHHSSLRAPKPLSDDFLGRKETGSNDVNDQLDSDEFMRRMISGELEKWDHQDHLRAGFLTLKKCILKESVIFDAADLFLERLDMMLKAAPHKFRDTSPHRTLTIFWLHRIYHNMLSFYKRTGLFPDRKGFNDVILENPDLTDSSSWDLYYSKDVLSSPEAKNGWKLLNIKSLPHHISCRAESQQRTLQTQETNKPEDLYTQLCTIKKSSEIYKRFAFATFKTMTLSKWRRDTIISETMSVLQSHIMRLRATLASSSNRTTYIDPYSETQAFFWIQMLHAALESIPTNSGLDITNLHFKSISILFPSLFETDDIWRRYYTEKLWTSLKARAHTALPDLKSLPTALQTPEQWLIQRAVASVLYEKYPYSASDASLSYCSSNPSAEELLLEVRWAVKEASNSSFNNSMIPATHAMLVCRIFNYLLDAEILPDGDRNDSRRTSSLSTASWDATSFLHQQGRPHETKQRYTAAVFWSHMVLHAFIETDKVSSFHAKFASWRLSSPSHQMRR